MSQALTHPLPNKNKILIMCWTWLDMVGHGLANLKIIGAKKEVLVHPEELACG